MASSISKTSGKNLPFGVMIGDRIPAVPRFEKYSGLIFGINFWTRLIIAVLEIELNHSFEIKDKNSESESSFNVFPVTISFSFEIEVDKFPRYPEYVSGLGTGTAFGPTSLWPLAFLSSVDQGMDTL